MRSRIAPAVMAFSIVQMSATAAPAPGQVELAAFRGVEGVAGLEASLDGRAVGVTDAAGKLSFNAGPGLHLLVLSGPSGRVAATEFRLGESEAGEIAVALPQQTQGSASVSVDVFNPSSLTLIEVTGTVRTASGTPAAGASVTAMGIGTSTETDAQGNFRLRLPRGSYTLEVRQGGAVKQFTGVSASPLLAASALALELDSAGTSGATGATELNKVIVRAPVRRGTTAAVERAATGVIDRVSQEEISIAGDSSAGEALKRVTGVTVQNDVIVVRGLGDRYSNTLLNGAEIPSPNPSRRVISLDVFPTELLGGLTVQKTYTANLPGDFSGGVALLESRPIPTVNKGTLEVELSGNSQTTGANTLTYQGSNGDDFGTDGGIRSIPTIANVLTNNGTARVESLPEAQRAQIARALPNIWDLRLEENTAPDFGLSAGYGGALKSYGDIKIGYQLSGYYDRDNRFRQEERNDLSEGADFATATDTAVVDRSELTIESGGLGNLSVEFDKANRIELVNLLSRTTEKSAFYALATNTDGLPREEQRVTLDFIESQLFANQLTGRHLFAQANDLELKWQVNYASAERDVLDRRSYELTRGADVTLSREASLSRPIDGLEDLYRLPADGQDGNFPQRDYEFLKDDSLDLGLDGKLPVDFSDAVKSEFKAGVRTTRKSRDFSTVRYQYFVPNPGSTSNLSQAFQAARFLPSLEQILVPNLFGTDGGFDIRSINTQSAGGSNSESYTGDYDIDAFYVVADTSYEDTYKADIGVRVEKSDINVITGSGVGSFNTRLEETDILPAVNLTWFLNKQQQLRFGYSQTVNRPQFRELTPVLFLDPETRFNTFGNPNLTQSEIQNFDLRFEQYWTSDKAVSVALFYKDFKNPIENTVEFDSAGTFRSFTNSPSAVDYGIELDGRYKLDALKDFLPIFNRMYIAGNLTFIESEVKLAGGQTRELQGQSPYIFNITLGYSVPGKTDVALLFNTFGDRISEVGQRGVPDAIEQSYPLLDFNVRHTFNPSWRVAAKLRNLLDPDIEVLQGDVAQRRYQLGVSGQVSLEYQF